MNPVIFNSFAEGGAPFLCGGYRYGIDYSLCLKYQPANDSWVFSGEMVEERSLSGYGSSESWGLVMAGGRNSFSLATIATTSDGEYFGSLPGSKSFNTVYRITERVKEIGPRLRDIDIAIGMGITPFDFI